jgi:hypothetical protein
LFDICVPPNTDARHFKKTSEGIVRSNDLKPMSIDELWKLHEEVTIEFAQKLWSEEIELEQRLRHLQEADNISCPAGCQRLTLDTNRSLIRTNATQTRRRSASIIVHSFSATTRPTVEGILSWKHPRWFRVAPDLQRRWK